MYKVNEAMTIDEVKELVNSGRVVGDFIKDSATHSSIPFPTSIVEDIVYYSTGSKINTHKMVENADGTFYLVQIK